MLPRTPSALVPTPSKAISTVKEALTPRSSTSKVALSTNVTPSPGSFRHPRMTEIIERQSATSFNGKNIQIAFLNASALIGTIVLGSSISSLFGTILKTLSVEQFLPGPTLLLNFLRAVFIFNIAIALRQKIPYIRNCDTLNDIPLTPTQRVLLGLPPSQSSATGTGNAKEIVTPPRYRRSSSSLAGTPQAYSADRRSISAHYSSSPLSTSRYTIGFSPSPQSQSTRRASGSPFSPGSPLLHRALTSTSARNELLSFGDSVQSGFETSTSTIGNRGLQRSQSLRERSRKNGDPGTPSPGSKRQPGLNYKWLYEKGYKVPLDGSFA